MVMRIIITLTLMLMIITITVIYFFDSIPLKSSELPPVQADTAPITLPTFHLD